MATVDELTTMATFAASGVVLLVGHNLADHVTGQSDWQAEHKGAPKPEDVAAGASPHRGWLANLAHVGQYHLTLIALGFLSWLVLPLHWSALGVVSALVWSAGTHALLDRRWPVRWLLDHTGSSGFARLNAGGLALGVSAVLLAVL
jgi:hypothetical protein